MGLFEILAGVLALIGTALPLYFKWRKLKGEYREKATTAPDNPELAPRNERMRKRLEDLRRKERDGKEK